MSFGKMLLKCTNKQTHRQDIFTLHHTAHTLLYELYYKMPNGIIIFIPFVN